MTTFHRLEEYHTELEALFARHQAAVVERRFDEARRLLLHYRGAVAAHAQEEELELLPVLRAYAGDVPGGTQEIFRKEHAKLVAMIDEALETMGPPGSGGTTGQVIALLELEAHYKNLFAHHVLREHNVLFPTLDRVIGEPERARILGNCTLHVADTGEAMVSRPGGHESLAARHEEKGTTP